MAYKVETKYDDGYESVKEFESLSEAKAYFQNVDERDIEFSSVTDENGEIVAKKEGKKRK